MRSSPPGLSQIAGITRASFNGGINTSYAYDGIDRLTSLVNTPAANAGYANTYGFGYNPELP